MTPCDVFAAIGVFSSGLLFFYLAVLVYDYFAAKELREAGENDRLNVIAARTASSEEKLCSLESRITNSVEDNIRLRGRMVNLENRIKDQSATIVDLKSRLQSIIAWQGNDQERFDQVVKNGEEYRKDVNEILNDHQTLIEMLGSKVFGKKKK